MTSTATTTDNATLDRALELARLGFHITPAKDKRTLPKGWPELATSDPAKLAALFEQYPEHPHPSICTGRFGANEALLVIDIDPRNCERPENAPPREVAEAKARELYERYKLPRTRMHWTPSGGLHLIFRVPHALTQGAHTLGRGIDTRSAGGQIHFGLGYTWVAQSAETPALAPQALIDACGKRAEKRPVDRNPVAPLDTAANVARAMEYLKNRAPVAVQGQGGDATTFQVAARLKDLGLSEARCYELLLNHWSDRCSPPWHPEDLASKVRNAYQYGKEAPGSGTPQAHFPPMTRWTAQEIRESVGSGRFEQEAGYNVEGAREAVNAWETLDLAPQDMIDQARAILARIEQEPASEHPFDKLNKYYAFVIAGGKHHILFETTDAHGHFKLEHLDEAAFHKKHAGWELQVGKSSEPATKLWMSDAKRRRSYDGLVFMPGQTPPPNYYNLFRGYAVEPWPRGEQAPPIAQRGLDLFLEHIGQNIAQGDGALTKWVLSFFAHLFQRPWEKPEVALVLRGRKGLGKSVIADHMKVLLGPHAFSTAHKRYLIGNFNQHLEACLLLVLEEAAWAGEKEAGPILKDLITGKQHVIEPKGKGAFTVDNRTRVLINSNERWVVPASEDERRYTVIDVGEGRKEDDAFFGEMAAGLESGGYRLLLRYLLDLDLAGFNIRRCYQTKALLDQKIESLEPFDQWWFDCLKMGHLAGSDFGGEWPEFVETERFRLAFERYFHGRNMRSRLPSEDSLGRALKRVCPLAGRIRVRRGEERPYCYRLPELAECRTAWEKHMGGEFDWE